MRLKERVANRAKYGIRVTRTAGRDIVAVTNWSLKEFGEDADLRYDALITQALTDIGDDPERAGSRQRFELAKGVLIYHLRFSRDRAKSVLGVVHHPRHFVIYRRQEHLIEILRVLHDTRELQRHMPGEYRNKLDLD